jgi:hypothetical protein
MVNVRLHLKPGVFHAACDGEGIVMDLMTNRYVAVSTVGTQLLTLIERGFNPDEAALDLSRSAGLELDERESRALVESLLASWERDQLITRAQPAINTVPRSRPRGRPATEPIDLQRLLYERVSKRAVARCLAASAWYRFHLRREGLISALHRLVAFAPKQPAQNDDALYAIARATRFVRSALRHGKPDCLDRSITLALALRWAGIDAEVCFGVRRVPFTAHCWVEVNGRTVLQKTSKIEYNSIIARF